MLRNVHRDCSAFAKFPASALAPSSDAAAVCAAANQLVRSVNDPSPCKVLVAVGLAAGGRAEHATVQGLLVLEHPGLRAAPGRVVPVTF